MLVLTRREGEQVFLDTPAGRIIVTVMEIHSGCARIGFKAPQSITIIRSELDRETPTIEVKEQ